MTEDTFRRLALAMPEAVERSHMGHPDFRVRGRIFATLFGIDDESGMVKLTPEEQEHFVKVEPAVFSPVKGGWGERGATRVCLRSARVAIVRRAMLAAWRNAAPKALVKDSGSGTPKTGRRAGPRSSR